MAARALTRRVREVFLDERGEGRFVLDADRVAPEVRCLDERRACADHRVEDKCTGERVGLDP